MTMSAGTLKTAMHSAIMSAIAAWDAISADDHRLTGYDQSAFWSHISTAISNTVVDHITNNAKATGTDSRGDTHILDIA